MHTEKNIKNPAVMAELFELSCCTYGFTPESKLSRKPQAQYGFVPKFSHHSGKNKKNQDDVFNVFSSDAVCVSPVKPLMGRSLCESLLSGTNERGSNEGRRPQTAPEGFLRFL